MSEMLNFESLKESICEFLRMAGEPKQKRLRVLVLEDSHHHFEMLKGLLERHYRDRYKIDHAETVEDALALIQSKHYDAYVVDWFLSLKDNGDSFIKKAYKMGITGPFIVWSGKRFTEPELKNLCGGIPVGYIEKAHSTVAMMDKIIRGAVAEYRTNNLSGIVVPDEQGAKVIRRECLA